MNDICLYDICNNKWDTLVTYGFHPHSRWGHTMCSSGKDQLIIFGGVNLDSYCSSGLNLLNTNPKSLKTFLGKFEGYSKIVRGKYKMLTNRK